MKKNVYVGPNLDYLIGLIPELLLTKMGCIIYLCLEQPRSSSTLVGKCVFVLVRWPFVCACVRHANLFVR